MIESTDRKFVMTPLAAAVIASLSPSGSVVAQEEDKEASSLAIDEILVTATKRELSLQDVPHSIDVLSATELGRMGARDLQATLRALPSVYLTALQPGQNSLVIRGISTGPFEYRTEAQVAVYLDEQPMTFNSQQVGIRNIDMARVENLPGPQGTLFGSSSQTGTIRYITNKPETGSFYGQVEARGGTTRGGENSHDINGFLNIPLVDDVLAARVVAYTSHDGGYIDNVYGTSLSGNYDNADRVENDFNEYDVDGGRLHVLWNLNDRWSTLFSVVAENTAAVGVWDSDAGLGDYDVTRFEDEFRDDDWYSASMTISGDLGFADLTMTATRFERDIVYEYDNMTYTQYKDATYSYALYNTNYYRSSIFNDQIQDRDSYELRLVSSGESRFQWMVGAYYEDIFDDWFYGTRLPDLTNTTAWAAAQAYAYYHGVVPNYYNNYTPNLNQVYPLPDSDIGYSNRLLRTVTQTAVFGEFGYDLTDNLKIHAGMRWAEFDRDKYEIYDFPRGLIPFPALPDGEDGSFRDVGKKSDTIYKVGLQYNVDDDRMLYALYSQGFRVGGANSSRAFRTGRLPARYKGDFMDNYEVGLKSQWLDRRLTVNASAFFMEWKDYLQDASFDEWWLTGTVNAGGAETTGIEVQAEFQATERLSFSVNLFLANAKFQDNFCNLFVGGEPQSCPVDGSGNVIEDELDIRKGMPLPNSPDSTAWASIYYEVPDVLGGALWFYYDFSYSDEIWNDTDEIVARDRQGLAPSYTYSNFSAGLQLANQLDIEIYINNLFDQKGYSYIWTGEADYATYFGDRRYRQQRAQDRPMTFWLALRKGFGGT